MHGYSRVLVTGGAGFIGSHLVDQLLSKGLEVVVLDNLSEGYLKNVKQHIGKENFQFVRGDIRDYRLVKELAMDVDAVFHLAALISVPESIKDPAMTDDVNVDGTLNLLKAFADSSVKRFVYASSCAVYGEAESLPIREDCPLKPTSPYGVSKVAAENYVRVFHDIYGLDTVCLRFFNVYGPRQAYSDYSGVITQFLNRVSKNLHLVIFGDGEQTRDFVHVHDVVEANILALRTKRIAGEIFNIGTGMATTINQLADMLLEVTNKTRLKVTHSKPKKGEIKHSVADISKAKMKLRYYPKVSLKEGLKDLTKSSSIQK
jgi:UDP-glucose 4-epimerase